MYKYVFERLVNGGSPLCYYDIAFSLIPGSRFNIPSHPRHRIQREDNRRRGEQNQVMRARAVGAERDRYGFRALVGRKVGLIDPVILPIVQDARVGDEGRSTGAEERGAEKSAGEGWLIHSGVYCNLLTCIIRTEDNLGNYHSW